MVKKKRESPGGIEPGNVRKTRRERGRKDGTSASITHEITAIAQIEGRRQEKSRTIQNNGRLHDYSISPMQQD